MAGIISEVPFEKPPTGPEGHLHSILSADLKVGSFTWSRGPGGYDRTSIQENSQAMWRSGPSSPAPPKKKERVPFGRLSTPVGMTVFWGTHCALRCRWRLLGRAALGGQARAPVPTWVIY